MDEKRQGLDLVHIHVRGCVLARYGKCVLPLPVAIKNTARIEWSTRVYTYANIIILGYTVYTSTHVVYNVQK